MEFTPNRVRVGSWIVPLDRLVWAAYYKAGCLHLAAGFYKTPKMHYIVRQGATGSSIISLLAPLRSRVD